ncbi:MAG: NAD(P)-dependent oxidoreductase [Anaerolineales bacterium]|nr:NAD(P)-dependent oxidoreductase [Anaerolineales bacterium]
MRAFVTGGTGFLGRHLIDHLLAQGGEVVSLVRTSDRARSVPAGVRTVAGDITRPASLRAGIRGLAGLRRADHSGGRRPSPARSRLAGATHGDWPARNRCLARRARPPGPPGRAVGPGAGGRSRWKANDA